MLLEATNRLAEAEPLMRRTLAILLEFTRAAGHAHPNLQGMAGNYASLLSQMGHSQQDAWGQIRALAERYGVRWDG